MSADQHRKTRRNAIVIGFIYLLGMLLSAQAVFEPLEEKTIDLRLQLWRQDRSPETPMSLILVDDASLDAMAPMAGRWPWPRGVHANLIDFLSVAGAKAVVFDILFSEVQSGRQHGRGEGNDDERLCEATTLAGNVYHALHLVRGEGGAERRTIQAAGLTPTFEDAFSLSVEGDAGPAYEAAYPPFDALYAGAKGVGVVTFHADGDGVYRRERLLFAHGDGRYASLGLAPLLDFLEIDGLATQRQALVITGEKGPLRHIPIDAEGRYRINPYGRFETYSYSGVYLSALQFFNGQFDGLPVDPTRFEGRIVFIGTSASGIGDLKTSPLQVRTPGVYLHAALLANVVDEDYLNFTPIWIDAVIGLLLLAAAVMAVSQRPSYFQKVGLPLLLAGGYAGLTILTAGAGWMLPVVEPLFILAGGFLAAMTVQGFTDGRERRRIRRIMGQYVSPAVLTSLLGDRSYDRLKAEVGSERYLTLFFSDLRGFTGITEQYPVETVVKALNTYLSRMVGIIFDRGGTLDKFIGDAVMAFWGAPLAVERQHHQAVSAALEMQKAMGPLNHSGLPQGYPELRMGIGIHSGSVILGNIGSTKKLDYTVIGDSVNFTSRLESLTKFYNAKVLISETTHSHVADAFCCRVVDRVCVKGKTEPIQIYEVLDYADTKNEVVGRLAELTNRGFDSYLERDFDRAHDQFTQVLDLKPQDRVGLMFTERCRTFLEAPPPMTWKGEFVCQEK